MVEMEVENIKKSSSSTAIYNTTSYNNKELIGDEDDVPLPGFRFHPTDEELVGFYLRRKVDKRPIAIELIKQIDIYKFDPWDLPKGSNVGDKEWYFYCKRGRKYRNSIRPNRVTGSGFWKATGIDRPIYSSSSAAAAGDAARRCIGLKKSLVYYRGSAGKGTKTDWMMHEFRLPPDDKTTKLIDNQTTTQEAEVWTLCRILKRNVSYKKCVPDWREVCNNGGAKRINGNPVEASSKACSTVESSDCQSYISFTDPGTRRQMNERKPFPCSRMNEMNHLPGSSQLSSTSVVSEQPPPSASYANYFMTGMNEMLLKNGDWDELGSVVGFAADPFIMFANNSS